MIEKVLEAFINARRDDKGVIDYMESVTPLKLGITKEEFSKALYELQEKEEISGVVFNPNSHDAELWDDVSIHIVT